LERSGPFGTAEAPTYGEYRLIPVGTPPTAHFFKRGESGVSKIKKHGEPAPPPISEEIVEIPA